MTATLQVLAMIAIPFAVLLTIRLAVLAGYRLADRTTHKRNTK